MRLVFLGTSEFAARALEALVASRHEVALVVTQPDRPAGRGRRDLPPPVKVKALESGLDLDQPERINTRAARARIRAAQPEVAVVAAYGQILRPLLLALPPRGCLNIHASILPRHRGASPINAQILAGDPEVGVSIMRMDEGLDTGPVGLVGRLPALPRETAGELHDRLAELGARLIVEALDRLEAGDLEFEPQDEARASHAGLMRKSDAALDFAAPVGDVDRQVRGHDPWPGAHADLVHADQRLRVRLGRVTPLDDRRTGIPGEIVAVGAEGIDVACAPGLLRIESLQPSGRRMMPVADFLNGHPLTPGDHFARPLDV
ncbi:MAG: methionyl-tRNA formyltransferase [Planctomycetes bacterium]|nr:methionyl-tRNA formyltransferase [Planctomycetota bacterium]